VAIIEIGTVALMRVFRIGEGAAFGIRAAPAFSAPALSGVPIPRWRRHRQARIILHGKILYPGHGS